MKTFKIKVEVSARHCHLDEKIFRKLFGKEASLNPIKNLSQPGEFASKETIEVLTNKGEISRVRVIGPLRKYNQIELSGTDSHKLGLTPPIRMSGKLKNSSAVTLIGPLGKVKMKDGVILAHRHIHASLDQAKKYGLKNGQIVRVEIKGERALTFDRVEVKTNENYDLAMHIDTDEANSCGFGQRKIFGKVIFD